MSDHKTNRLNEPDKVPLQEKLQRGARELLSRAIEVELNALRSQYSELGVNRRQAVGRSEGLPQETRKTTSQTELDDLKIGYPKLYNDSEQTCDSRSTLLPPYLKRTKVIEEFIPWLYLRGITTNKMRLALGSMLGSNAEELSAESVHVFIEQWKQEYDVWQHRDLSNHRYAYIWADGISTNASAGDNLCLLVIVGANITGRKELLAVVYGVRDSEESWLGLLSQLRSRGMTMPPELAIGDDALGLWKALTKIWPDTVSQHCWVHKTVNVLKKVPSAMQPDVKEAIREIWKSETKYSALKAFNTTIKRFEAKYPKAMECLAENHTSMLTFYDFPAQHWPHVRTNNLIASVFASVLLRTTTDSMFGASRKTTLVMTYKLIKTAQSKWCNLREPFSLSEITEGNTK